MRLRKPAAVENDPYKSAKWDELTAGRSFAQSDAPTLALLCLWHKVADTAMDERTASAARRRTRTTWATLRRSRR